MNFKEKILLKVTY